MNIPVCYLSVYLLSIYQFIMMEVQGFSMLVFGTPFPIRVCLLYCSYVGTLLVLFVDFAVRTYGRDGQPSRPAPRPASQTDSHREYSSDRLA